VWQDEDAESKAKGSQTMNMQEIGEIIQFILAPVVMISACSLVLNGLLTRYAAINDRLRVMSRERLELLRAGVHDSYSTERLSEVDAQIPELLKHHHLTHNAVLLVYGSIFLFIVTMLVIAVEVVSGASWMAGLILLCFIAAVLSLMVAVATAVREVYSSQNAIRYEAERVLGLDANTLR
jgi:uncharacterized membrane protein YphA (DoxX/SURF4 family)